MVRIRHRLGMKRGYHPTSKTVLWQKLLWLLVVSIRPSQQTLRTTQPPIIYSPISTLSYSPTPTIDSNSAEFPKSQNLHHITRLQVPVQTADPQGSRPLRLRLSRPSG